MVSGFSKSKGKSPMNPTEHYVPADRDGMNTRARIETDMKIWTRICSKLYTLGDAVNTSVDTRLRQVHIR